MSDVHHDQDPAPPVPLTPEERMEILAPMPRKYGRDWMLREARRLAFEAGVCDSSRITALQELLKELPQ